MMMGNLHRVKLLQFVEPKMSVTILIKATQEMMGIIKHLATLFRGKMELRSALMEVWRLRDIEDSSSLSHFDFATNPYPIMNILIWNCRGVLKPQFRKVVMDLVKWHLPIIIIIMKTRLRGARVDEIIETLPFDRAIVTNTIGFARGIWLLWHSDLVQVDVLATTELEIYAFIWEPAESYPQQEDSAHTL